MQRRVRAVELTCCHHATARIVTDAAGRPAITPETSPWARRRRTHAQTGEQDSSWPATRKELPQPQAATTLGFSTLKPAPVSASM